MLTAELDEVHGVTRDTDGQLGIVLRMHHRIFEHLTIKDVHIEVVCTLGEVAVHHRDEVLILLALIRAQRVRDNAKGITDTIGSIGVVELSYRAERSNCPMVITPMHWISTWSERHTLSTTIRGSPCLLAIHHVRSDCQDGERRLSILVDRKLLEQA